MKHFVIALLVAVTHLVACAHTQQPSNTLVLSTTPKEVYGNTNAPIQLRIGNGGAGPTGVLRALAEDFLTMKQADYAIAWYQNISRLNLEALKDGSVDIALTYERDQEDAYLSEGFATKRTLIFNDHFVVVGPKHNPAAVAPGDSPQAVFDKIAKLGAKVGSRTFLSRDDQSATNAKEQFIWEAVKVTPWKDATPSWYYRHTVFPKDALIAADAGQMYTIIDEGTWLSTRQQLKNSVAYAEGGELLRNPCAALLQASPSPLARDFLAYMVSPRGQALIQNYGSAANAGNAFFTPAAQPDFAVSANN